MPWSAFSRALSLIFYTILLRRFCMLAGIVSEIGCGGDLGVQTVIFCSLESFYYQMHFVFILFAINHKLIAYWAISGFLFFHIKKAVSSNSKSLFLIIVIRQFTCPIVWVPFYRGRRNNPFYHLIFTVSAFHNPAFSFYIEYYNNKSYLFLKYLIIRINR